MIVRGGGERMDMIHSARALIGWKKWPIELLRDASARVVNIDNGFGTDSSAVNDTQYRI